MSDLRLHHAAWLAMVDPLVFFATLAGVLCVFVYGVWTLWNPVAIYILTRRAQAALRRRNYERAFDLTTRQIERDRSEPNAWAIRAAAAFMLGDYVIANADVERSLTLSPGNPRALAVRGCLHFTRGNHDAAIADLSIALQHDPSPHLYLYRGYAHLALGDQPAATLDAQQALAHPSTAPLARELQASINGG